MDLCGPGVHLRHLVSVLSSIYWTLSAEQDGAVNGYTLTRGLFTHQLQVEYATGQSVCTTRRHYVPFLGDRL